MATNLLKDGFSVLGYDIRAGVLKKLKDLGIKAGMGEDDFSLLYKKFHKLTEIDQKLWAKLSYIIVWSLLDQKNGASSLGRRHLQSLIK